MTQAAEKSVPQDVESIVDTECYRLDDDAQYSQVIAKARAQLAAESCATFPEFIRAEAMRAMAAESLAALPKAYRRDKQFPAYSVEPGEQWPEGHPRQILHWNRQYVTPTDTLPRDGQILALFRWDRLTKLVADVLGEPKMYRVADPLISCVTTIMGESDQHGWHFDRNDFVVSLLLQKPERGGEFEFAPYVRSDADENYDGVKRVLTGASDKSKIRPVEEGTLMIFCGRRAVHRVTPIQGQRKRIIALFSYDRSPDHIYPPQARLRAVGRTEVLH